MNVQPKGSLGRAGLARDIMESHFTLAALEGALEIIDIEGAGGWTSPNPHPVLSLMRWTTTDETIAAQALDHVLDRFKDRACGFDWLTGPDEDHLVPLLSERGFIPPALEVGAMVRVTTNVPPVPDLEGLHIWKVNDPDDPRISSIMSKGFEVPEDVGAIYHRAYVTPTDLQRTDIYAMSATGSHDPVAVGYLSYIGDGPSVLMRVSSTLESQRGQGIYRALVLHRLHEAAKAGRSEAFVHAYSEGSLSALKELGFDRAGTLNLHRWRP